MMRLRIWGGRRMARIMFALVALTAFAGYMLSSVEGIFPGLSAAWMATCLGLDAMSGSDHLLWRVFGGLVARLPLPDTVRTLNAASALCGALGVGLVFSITRAWILIVSLHTSAVPGRRRKNAANLAGLVAAAALGGSVPFWIASTRFLPQAFETLLLLWMGWLLVVTATACRPLSLSLFGLLLGMSVFESDTGLRLAPVFLILVLRAMRMGGLRNAQGYAALAGGVAAGIVGYLTLAWMARGVDWLAGSGHFATPLRDLMASAKAQYVVITSGWRYDPRLLAVVFFALAPWAAAGAISIWRTGNESRAASWMLMLVIAGTAAVSLTGATVSPWGSYRGLLGEQALPTTVYAIVAMVAGYLAGSGCLHAGGRLWARPQRRRRGRDDDDDERDLYPDASPGRLVAWSAILFVCMMMLLNRGEVRRWREPLSNLVAADVVSRIGTQSWLVSESPLITQIRLRAHLAGKRIQLLRPRQDPIAPASRERLQRLLVTHPAFEGVSLPPLTQAADSNALAFVAAWIATDPAADRKLLVMNRPELWEQGQWTAIPDGVLYRGLRRRPDATNLLEVVASQQALWTRVDRLPPFARPAPHWLQALRFQVREELSAGVLRLAALSAEAGRSADADALLERSRRLKEEPVPLQVADTPFP